MGHSSPIWLAVSTTFDTPLGTGPVRNTASCNTALGVHRLLILCGWSQNFKLFCLVLMKHFAVKHTIVNYTQYDYLL